MDDLALSTLYLVLIVGFLMFSYRMPEIYDKKIYDKYGIHIYDKQTAIGCGIFMILWLLSTLMANIVSIIFSIIIIVVMCRLLRMCWSKCLNAGLDKKEVKTALFLQILYPLGMVMLVLGFLTILEKYFGRRRRRY